MTIDGVNVSSMYYSIATKLDKEYPVCIPVGKGSVIVTGSSGKYPTLYGVK